MRFNEPLGQPQGTVRAVIALIVIGSAIAAYMIPAVSESARTFLGGMAGVAFGYYFGARGAETQEQPRSESEVLVPSAPLINDEEPDETPRTFVAGD